MEEERELRRKVLEALVNANDTVMIAVGNYTNEEDGILEIEFAVNADSEEIFNMFVELMKNKAVRNEARRAILFSDYGKTNDSLDLN